jgi:Zn-dependent M32 family carboxypeptidase
VSARKESDFSKFAPFLQQWVDVNKQKAAAIDPSAPAYNVLLDDYEKGMTSARLDEIFAEVGGTGGQSVPKQHIQNFEITKVRGSEPVLCTQTAVAV